MVRARTARGDVRRSGDGARPQLVEYIPFGSNQIVALNERLGALDRCKGGLFTAMVDSKPTDTHLTVNPGHTQVSILDFELVRFGARRAACGWWV